MIFTWKYINTLFDDKFQLILENADANYMYNFFCLILASLYVCWYTRMYNTFTLFFGLFSACRFRFWALPKGFITFKRIKYKTWCFFSNIACQFTTIIFFKINKILSKEQNSFHGLSDIFHLRRNAGYQNHNRFSELHLYKAC